MIVDMHWESGKMSVDADYLLEEMPIAVFRKWCKMFAVYGNSEQGMALSTYMIDRIIRKEKSVEGCSERYRPMEERNLKRYRKVHSILKDVLRL